MADTRSNFRPNFYLLLFWNLTVNFVMVGGCKQTIRQLVLPLFWFYGNMADTRAMFTPNLLFFGFGATAILEFEVIWRLAR